MNLKPTETTHNLNLADYNILGRKLAESRNITLFPLVY